MISAKVIADSVNPNRKRITTLVLEYPRFIHAEFMTHRLFSRNASSSRAIPVEKQIERIKKDPALPVFWGKNQKGMQAEEELPLLMKTYAESLWLKHRDEAVRVVEHLHQIGLHKQHANRLLEPWMHISVVCTATEWGNWFNLRYHKAAQPEIQVLAKAMWEAMSASTPTELGYGDWHLPFVDTDARITALARAQGREPTATELLLKMSAARCARVSYRNHEGKIPDLDEDLATFDKLMGGFPKHASPTEHQAKPADWWQPNARSGNFQGWVQFRKLIPGEYMPEYRGPA